MTFNRSYAFFLLITVIGAFLTIKICNTAYAVYDYSGDTTSIVGKHYRSNTPVTSEELLAD